MVDVHIFVNGKPHASSVTGDVGGEDRRCRRTDGENSKFTRLVDTCITNLYFDYIVWTIRQVWCRST